MKIGVKLFTSYISLIIISLGIGASGFWGIQVIFNELKNVHEISIPSLDYPQTRQMLKLPLR